VAETGVTGKMHVLLMSVHSASAMWLWVPWMWGFFSSVFGWLAGANSVDRALLVVLHIICP